MIIKNRYLPYLIVGVLLLGGGFFTGLGLERVLDHAMQKTEYENSSVTWKRRLAEGMEDSVVRDIRNRELTENLKHIDMRRELLFDDGASPCEAGITNREESLFCFRVQLVRDATGELLYESGILEPGFSILSLRLNTKLQKGYYPCTAVWSFYTPEDEYVGEAAWKTVVIIEN